jgi:beta-lactamase regulating signal transducer with metallopeptidase domain
MVLLCFSENLNYALGWTLLHSLWQALVITILTGTALLLMQKKTARLRYLIANAGLWLVFLAAVLTFVLYYDFSKEAGQMVFTPDLSDAPISVSSNDASEIVVTPTAQKLAWHFDWKSMKSYLNHHIYSIVLLWFMGFIIFILKIMGSISYVFYLRNRLNFPADEYWQEQLDKLCQKFNIKQNISLVESALVRSPLVVGHLKPMILFPIGAINRLNINEVEAIMAHELAHILRHDYLYNILQYVIEAIFYFHPAVWWLSSQVRIERENCCDDIAIAACGSAVTYAKSLVSVQEMAFYTPQLALAFAGQSRKKQLLVRVQRILNQPKSKLNMIEKLASTSILLLVLLGFVFGNNPKNNSFYHDLGNETNITAPTSPEELQSNSSVHFLKFKKDGELDSLPVDKNITDGNYNFINNLYDVNMTIKNQHVVTFTINGLAVNGKDIPKFEKMINQLVHNDEKTETTTFSKSNEHYDDNLTAAADAYAYSYSSSYGASTGTFIDKNRITIVKEDGSVEKLKYDNNGVNELEITTNDDANSRIKITYKNKRLQKNGKPMSQEELKQLGWYINDKGLEPIGGYNDIKIMSSNSNRFPTPPPPPHNYADVIPNPPATYERKNFFEESYEEDKENLQNQIASLRKACDELKRIIRPAKATLEVEKQLILAEAALAKKELERAENLIEAAQSGLDNLTQQSEQQEQEKAQQTAEKERSKSAFSMSFSHRDTKTDDAKEENFNSWLTNEWVKDGYLVNDKKYKLVWTNTIMKVNGKKVSEAHLAKYVKMHRQITGNSLGNDFKITKNVSE